MAEKKVKAETVKKPVAVKAEAKKEAPAKAAGKTVTLVQVASPIGRQDYQRGTLIGLGLNKMGRTRTLQDTPAVRGMIARVKHLVNIVE